MMLFAKIKSKIGREAETINNVERKVAARKETPEETKDNLMHGTDILLIPTKNTSTCRILTAKKREKSQITVMERKKETNSHTLPK